MARPPAAQASCVTQQGTFSIQAAACPPIASFAPSATQVLPGATVSFDATSSHQTDQAFPITGYEWDFEGTGYASGPAQTTHVFATRGVYTVKLRVTTSDGTSGDQAEVSPADHRLDSSGGPDLGHPQSVTDGHSGVASSAGSE